MAQVCSSSYLGGWGKRITWTQNFEVVVNYDPTTALQPGQQSKNLSLKDSNCVKLINAFNNYLFPVYHMPATVQSTEDMAVTNTEFLFALLT